METIFAYWCDPTDNYETKVRNLLGLNSSPPNHPLYLDPSNMLSDGDVDFLYGRNGTDWFLRGYDSLNRIMDAEQVEWIGDDDESLVAVDDFLHVNADTTTFTIFASDLLLNDRDLANQQNLTLSPSNLPTTVTYSNGVFTVTPTGTEDVEFYYHIATSSPARTSTQPAKVTVRREAVTAIVLTGDIDGDRRTDVVEFDSDAGEIRRYLQTPTGQSTSVVATLTEGHLWKDVKAGDFNGDKRMDVAARDGLRGIWTIWLSTPSENGVHLVSQGNPFAESYQGWGRWDLSGNYADVDIGDFNGDGRDDIFGYDLEKQELPGAAVNPPNLSLTFFASISDGFEFDTSVWGSYAGSEAVYQFISTRVFTDVADLQGDSRDDVVVRGVIEFTDTTSLTLFTFILSEGMSFDDLRVFDTGLYVVNVGDTHVGDVDDDGKEELLLTSSAPAWGTRWTTLGWEDGELVVDTTWESELVADDVTLGDVNEDGRADLVSWNGTDWRVALSDGSRFTAAQDWNGFFTPFATTVTTSAGAMTVVNPSLPMMVAKEIYNDVYMELEFEVGGGIRKSAETAETTGKANAFEQAAILMDRLQEAGFSTNMKVGQVQMDDADFQQWLGTEDLASARTLMHETFLMTTADRGATSGKSQFYHAWVDVNLPRASDFGSFSMDPSIKSYTPNGHADDVRCYTKNLLAVPDCGPPGGGGAPSVPEVEFDPEQAANQNNAAQGNGQGPQNAAQNVQDDAQDALGDLADNGQAPLLSTAALTGKPTVVPRAAKYTPELAWTQTTTAQAANRTIDNRSDTDAVQISHFIELTLSNSGGTIWTTDRIYTSDFGSKSMYIAMGTLDGYTLPIVYLDGQALSVSDYDASTLNLQNVAGTQTVSYQFKTGQIRMVSSLTDGFYGWLQPLYDSTPLLSTTASSVVAPVVFSGAFTDAGLADHQSELTDASLASMAANSTPVADTAIIGETLWQVGAKWFRETDKLRDEMASMFNSIYATRDLQFAFVYSDGDVYSNYYANNINPIVPTGVQINATGYLGVYSREDLNPSDPSDNNRDPNLREVIGTTESQLEESVLEQVLGADAVSAITVLGEAIASNDFAEITNTSDPDYTAWTNSSPPSALASVVNARLTAGESVYVTIGAITIGAGSWWAFSSPGFKGIQKAASGSQLNGGAELTGSAPVNHATPAANYQQTMAGSVSIATGAYKHSETDFSLTNIGIDLDFERFYDSSASATNIGMGKGWTHTYSHRLTISGSNLIWESPAGYDYTFTSNGTGGYNTPDLIYGKLETTSATEKTFTDKYGNKFLFGEAVGGGYYRLKEISDRFGRGVVVNYTSSTNQIANVADKTDAARKLTFSYSSGNISQVSDFTGNNNAADDRVWAYTYDSTHAYLLKAAGPESNVTDYEYNASGTALAGKLKTVYWPHEDNEDVGSTQVRDGAKRSITYFANGMTASVGDRVSGTVAGDDEIFNTTLYDYNLRYQTVDVTSPIGLRTTYSIDTRGLTHKVVYADMSREFFTYGNFNNNDPNTANRNVFDDYLLIGHTDIFGNETEYKYSHDQAANLVYATEWYDTQYVYTYQTGTTNNYNQLTSAKRYDAGANVSTATATMETLFEYTDAGKSLHRIKEATTVGTTYDVTEFGYYTTGDPTNLQGSGLVKTVTTPKGVATTGTGVLASDYQTTYQRDAKTGLATTITQTISTNTSTQTHETSVWTINYDQTTTGQSYGTGRGYATSVTDPTGVTSKHVYDELGRETQTILPDAESSSSTVTYSTTYNEAGSVTSVTDPKGYTTSYSHDQTEQTTKTTNADGTSTSQTYNSEYSSTSYTNELSNTWSTTYDYSTGQVACMCPCGCADTTNLDGYGLPSASSGTPTVTSYTSIAENQSWYYTTTDRAYGATSSRNESNISYYQTKTDKISETESRSTVTAYDQSGRVAYTEDGEGNRTTYSYDAQDRVTTIDGPGSTYAMSFQYDANDNVQYATLYKDGNASNSASTNTRTYGMVYDELDRATRTNTPDSAIYDQVVYDAAGRVTRAIDAEGRSIDYGYNFAGLLKTVTQPDPASPTGTDTAVTTYAYDSRYQVKRVTNAEGEFADYAYNWRGDVVLQTANDPDGEAGVNGPVTTRYTYDVAGQLVQLADSNLNATQFIYDTRGRMVKEVDSRGGVRLYEYDGDAKVVGVTDRNGRYTRTEYDGVARLTSEKWYASRSAFETTPTSPIETISYGYDKRDALVSAENASSAYLYVRDAIGRGTFEAASLKAGGLGLSTIAHSMTTEWNGLGERESLAVNVNGSNHDFTNTYTYDTLSRVDTLTQSGGINGSGGANVTTKFVDFDWEKNGNLATVTRKTSSTGTTIATTDYDYDRRNRLTSITHDAALSGESTIRYEYEFDDVGRITEMARLVDAVLAWEADYLYDETGQLTSAAYTGDHPLSSTGESHTYDEVGNRTSDGYQTARRGNLLLSDGTYQYTYDAEGNRVTKIKTADEKWAYAWDHRNRLTSVTYATWSSGTSSFVDQEKTEFAYDAFDRRVAKRFDSDLSVSGVDYTERFVYDGLDIAVVLDATGNVTHRYLHGPLVDQVLAEEFETGPRAGETLWHLSDHQGTVRELVDQSGKLVEQVDYDAFGNIARVRDRGTGSTWTVDTTITITSRFGFTGREWDQETGQYYHWHRYYDPRVGRWISEDPIGFAGGDANLYGWVNNSTISFRDSIGFYKETFLKSFGNAIETIRELIDTAGFRIHHIYEQAYRSLWEGLGIDIDEAKNLVAMDDKIHIEVTEWQRVFRERWAEKCGLSKDASGEQIAKVLTHKKNKHLLAQFLMEHQSLLKKINNTFGEYMIKSGSSVRNVRGVISSSKRAVQQIEILRQDWRAQGNKIVSSLDRASKLINRLGMLAGLIITGYTLYIIQDSDATKPGPFADFMQAYESAMSYAMERDTLTPDHITKMGETLVAYLKHAGVDDPKIIAPITAGYLQWAASPDGL